MNIKGCIALVTGANRGLGRAYTEALLGGGADKVYAAARDPVGITDARLTPIRLDVTSPTDIAAAMKACADIDLLINNAGAMLKSVPTVVWTRRRIRCSWLQIIGGYAGVLDGGKDVENMVYHGDFAWTGPRLG
jgi:NAD(P)-dependent dehydrogenase (short-subunit alcohol dehydrogenase family)